MVTKDFKPDRYVYLNENGDEEADCNERLNVHLKEDGTVSHVDHQ